MGRKLRMQYGDAMTLDGDTDDSAAVYSYVRVWLDGGWLGEAELHVRDGKTEIASICIRPEEEVPVGGLRRTTLEAVPVRAVREYGHHFAKRANEDPAGPFPAPSAPLRARPARPSPPAKALELQDVLIARMYLAEIDAGGQRGVHKRVAERLGADYDAKSVRRRIELMRGPVLTPASQGMAGGELTEYARSLLAGASTDPAETAIPYPIEPSNTSRDVRESP